MRAAGSFTRQAALPLGHLRHENYLQQAECNHSVWQINQRPIGDIGGLRLPKRTAQLMQQWFILRLTYKTSGPRDSMASFAVRT